MFSLAVLLLTKYAILLLVWLRSRGRIVGLDKLGTKVEHSFTDPELFYKPQVDNPEKFKNTPFDDLWVEKTTSKFKLDRRYGDNLQDNQYK